MEEKRKSNIAWGLAGLAGVVASLVLYVAGYLTLGEWDGDRPPSRAYTSTWQAWVFTPAMLAEVWLTGEDRAMICTDNGFIMYFFDVPSFHPYRKKAFLDTNDNDTF